VALANLVPCKANVRSLWKSHSAKALKPQPDLVRVTAVSQILIEPVRILRSDFLLAKQRTTGPNVLKIPFSPLNREPAGFRTRKGVLFPAPGNHSSPTLAEADSIYDRTELVNAHLESQKILANGTFRFSLVGAAP
jgi:hypothetical protein